MTIIIISLESDIEQALPLSTPSGDHKASQLMAGGEHSVHHHHKGTLEVAKRFIEAILFTKTPWPIISEGMYSMVDKAWKLTIDAQDRQRALAGAPVGTPSLCQLPGGLCLKIHQHI